ncbi:hypothetical protein CES85_5702 [Ochrobactrum quorumnocens]|uniref:Uncharacterized protein n=1 Tax=Ochrobactrum quorumnocens TaxID=271865 RepID=A0A248UDY6_9HYPH|nr:hypothetical protein CES85_5702 [[Ochrobactrum] quorumnocens]
MNTLGLRSRKIVERCRPSFSAMISTQADLAPTRDPATFIKVYMGAGVGAFH